MSTDAHAASNSTRKKSAFSCEACRRRKVKCGGEHPRCARCVARGDECLYKLQPSLSYTQRLERRVAFLEARLAEKSSEHREAKLRADSPASDGTADAALSMMLQGLELDKDGHVSFHGPTSFLYLATSREPQAPSPESPNAPRDGEKEQLVSNAWTERALEGVFNMPEPIRHLLDFHWCWIQPIFNFVYRPAFSRDMQSGGPYYSPLLLNAMLAHSVRWCRNDSEGLQLLAAYDNGYAFGQAVQNNLMPALEHGPVTIPTIQALLLLSARNVGQGNLTQSWLYSGMAFRMIVDLGIVIDGQKYAGSVNFSTEDIEIRNRLFWSCYVWDKLISLYLGRVPTLQFSHVSPPRIVLDDSAEFETWSPHGCATAKRGSYQPVQARSTSCFIQFCGLAEILNVVLNTLYNHSTESTRAQIDECVVTQSKALIDWFAALPEHLKMDVPSLPAQCPPSHIVTLNCAYHTINILLHRPMLASQFHRHDDSSQKFHLHHLHYCVRSALAIIAIFELSLRWFGYEHVTTFQAYTVYTAASIFLLQIQAMKDLNTNALDNLRFCVDTLEKLTANSPVIKAALSLIYKDLQRRKITLWPAGDVVNSWPGAAAAAADSNESEDLLRAFVPGAQDSFASAWDSDLLEKEYMDIGMSQDMFDVLSKTEPISANVNIEEPFVGFNTHA